MRIPVRLSAAVAALWLIGVAPPPALSQQAPATLALNQAAGEYPARLKSARNFLMATNVEKRVAEILPILVRQIASGLMPYFEKQIPNDKVKAELALFVEQLTAEIGKQFEARKGEFIDLMALVYARVLTVEQMDAMSEFYTSPAGRKFVEATPEIMDEIAPMIMKLIGGQPIEIDRNVDPAALTAAREMLSASKSEKMLDAMIAQTAEQATISPPAGSDPKEVERAQKITDSMQSNLTARRGERVDLIATMWAKRFAIQEMQAVTAFYRTPHGEAVTDAMPALLAEQQDVTQTFYQSMFADLRVKVKQMLPKPQATQP